MMAEAPTSEVILEETAQALRIGLARDDEAIAATYPLLRGLLRSGPNPWLSEELVARVRGMLLDLARQLLIRAGDEPHDPVSARQADLAALLSDAPAILGHVQCLAMEAHVTERLQLRSGLDPVLSALSQHYASVGGGATAELARRALGAQAAFVQQSSRMELPLRELPSDVLQGVLAVIRDFGPPDENIADRLERQLAGTYDEQDGRLGLIEQFVSSLADQGAALDLARAGLAIFVTALSLASRQERALVVMAIAGRQSARLALGLLATGLEASAVERQLHQLDPGFVMPPRLGELGSEGAFALLAGSRLGGAPVV